MSKFCGNCGAQLDDSVRVCGYCGTRCNTVEPTVTNTVDNTVSFSAKSSGNGKKLVAFLVAAVVIIVGVFSLLSFSNEECDWCGGTPTKKFNTQNDGKSYVCSDCRKECAWCGDRATKHYENLFGMVTFVCKDCYDDIVG